ncbi:MAG: hypothetical protein NT031_00660, partial [Planctomycetota bacterium]|nr:hypothetical protein [Planctomycetota bacterium]
LVAQPGVRAGTGGPASRPGGHHGYPHVIPPFAVEKLNLTDDQKKQLEDLSKEVIAKLEKILTPEQMKILHDARPPRPDRGPGDQGGQGGKGGHDRQGNGHDGPPPPPQDD